jgi:hypothetical protein
MISSHSRAARARGRLDWPVLASGLAVGLYAGRVLAESSARPWPLRYLLPLLLAALCAGLAASLIASRRRDVRPFLLLAIYVLWPTAAPLVALAALAGALGVFLMAHRAAPARRPWAEICAGIAGLILYVGTLSPGLLPADSGEFQLVSAVLGIAHPPGYPLYTLLGKAAMLLLPVRDAAYRLNLLSALLSAGTLTLLARTVRRQTGSAAAALVAAAALGLSTTFWAQATTANIRALTALSVAALVALALEWGRRRSPRLLWILAGTFGLAVGHHASLAPLALPLGAYVFLSEPALLRSPRRWAAPLGALAASFVVLLYLPVRSLLGAPFDPAPIRSVSGFLEHVLASGFRGDMFYFRTLGELAARVAVWGQILNLQFGPLLLAGALGGAVLVGRRDWRALLLLGGTFLVNTVLAVTYRAPQTVEYLLPSYVALVALLGYGLGTALPLMRSAWPRGIVVAALLCATAWNGWTNAPSFAALHRDDSTREAAEALLREAPEGAAILASWHRATPLWYLQYVEGLRRDVAVIYVYPEGATPNEEVWLRRIAEQSAARPVIVTNRFYAYEGSGYRLVPFGDAWLARREPLTEVPEAITPAEAPFGEELTLLGYRLSSATPRPGQTLELRVTWRAERPLARDYSTFAQLVGPQGVVGQGDLAHRATEFLPGEVRVDAYSIPLLLHAPPGQYQLITGFYYQEAGALRRLTSGAADHVVLTTVELLPRAAPFATVHPRADIFAGGLRLTGVDVDHSVAGQVRLYLHVARAAEDPLRRGPWRVDEAPLALLVSGADGTPLAQAELADLPPGAAAAVAVDLPGELREARLTVLGADGSPAARLGPWHLARRPELTLPLPTLRQHYLPLGGEMVFTGLGRLPEEASAGSAITLRPRFLSLRALTRDYSVSVGLARPDLGWEAKSDGTPALGAIPTLKWVRGWTVEDPHALPLEAGAPTGAAQVVLTVYDAFTLQPLNVLDERLVREGQGTSLRLSEGVEIR